MQANLTYSKKKKEVEKVASEFGKIKDKHTGFETKLASDEELLQTLLTGLSSSGAKNKGGGYMGQLADARARIAQAAAEEQQSKVKLSMNEKELTALEKKMQAFAKEAEDNMKKLENVKAAVEGIEGKIKSSGWSAEQDKDLDRQLREARDLCKNLAEVRIYLVLFLYNYSLNAITLKATRARQIEDPEAQL